MVFNSLEFLLFFIVVYFLYRALGHRLQNRMLLLASYTFYGFLDWRFLSLIWLSTIVDYICALKMDEAEDAPRRKLYLTISVVVNLSILGFFKYFDFFAGSLTALASTVGLELDYVTLNIILPVGISFYTFQTMSYTIDVYHRRMKPTRDFLDFALFVAFFPQLVAGPIERARHLLPQITRPRTPSVKQIQEGLWLILWGLFKKILIADNLAKIVDAVFLKTGVYSGGEALIATYAFAFQIYGDFSGYSDIARGLSKLLGIEIMVNFRFPYFVTNPREFWRNWHISLSTWLRDYLYIPLGGNRGANSALYTNLMLTMILGGLWHGASWIFVIWGTYCGVLLCAHRLIEPWLKRVCPKKGIAGAIWFYVRVVVMFHLTCLGWLIFRSPSLASLKQMSANIVFNFSLSGPIVKYYAFSLVFYIFILVALQLYKNKKSDMYAIMKLPPFIRWPIYIAIFYFMILFGEFGVKQFIYFQF